MLKEWNDSSKYYPRYRKIVSGNQNHIKPLLKALANASNSSLRRNADYSVSQMEVKPQFKWVEPQFSKLKFRCFCRIFNCGIFFCI